MTTNQLYDAIKALEAYVYGRDYAEKLHDQREADNAEKQASKTTTETNKKEGE